MTNEERISRIKDSASRHSGRFLLPHRFTRPIADEFKTETDHDYDACEQLVNRGEARWISGYSNLSPGIEFTRPLES
jgi:hypothetical protein